MIHRRFFFWKIINGFIEVRPLPINILIKKKAREIFLIKIFRAENFIYYITIMIQLCQLQMTKQFLRNFLLYPKRMKIVLFDCFVFIN